MTNPNAIAHPTEPTTASSAGAESLRYKLWELDPGLLCSILGTCLDVEDLKRVARKAGLAAPTNMRDYDIHGYFVTHCLNPSPLSKLTHKTLDRKYETHVARFKALRSPDELWSAWQKCLSEGNVAGGYWAFMTHRAVLVRLRWLAHNEVHMLSHLMGRCSSDNIRRVRDLEASCAALTERLSKLRSRSEETLKERDERILALEARLAERQTIPLPAAPATDEARQLKRLKRRYAVLERRLQAERARNTERPASLEPTPAERPGPAKHATAAVKPTELHPATPVASSIQLQSQTPPITDVDLNGAELLYVGGHASVAPHLREHVQRLNAELLYHDGGLEAHSSQLPGLVSKATAVFCPVDCVSHEAGARLKHLCKRQGKCLVWLRSSGLSSFATAVEAWAHR